MHRSLPGRDRTHSLPNSGQDCLQADQGCLRADLGRLASGESAGARRSPGLAVSRTLGRVAGAVVPGLFVCLTLLESVLVWLGTTSPATRLLVATASMAALAVWCYRIRTSLAPVEPTGDGPDPAVAALAAEPFTSVDDAAERLAALEALFRERGDRRAVFLTVYARVTRAVASEIEAGGFENPAWVADYLVTFADLYREALVAVEAGDVDALPGAWRLYFRTARTRDSLVLQQALLGINAHVNYDLARALRTVGVDGDRGAKYRDHRRINGILARLAADTPEHLGRTYAPGLPRLVDVAGPIGRRLWVLALAAGREVAWWVAVAHTESRFESVDRALGAGANAFSTGLAYLVLLPNGASVALDALGSVEGTRASRRLNRPQ